VFELPAGSSNISKLASFDGVHNGTGAQGTTLDSSDNLYGVTSSEEHGAGLNDDGTVFELAKGSSTITNLAIFNPNGTNGAFPQGVIMDGSGNLFGETDGDSASNIPATIFEAAKGSSTITTIATFTSQNGVAPISNLVMDSGGNLFGTTYGSVYELLNRGSAPTINVSTNSLNLGTSTIGSPGTPASYTVSGVNLQGGLVITAPSGVQVSSNGGTNWGSSVTLLPTGGTVATTIEARISATAPAGPLSGTITDTSINSNEQDVAASGTVNALFIAADFPGHGISRYVSSSGWQNILPFDAQQVVVDTSGVVYARFGPNGVWYTPSDQNHWKELDSRNANWIGVDTSKHLLADFPGSGLYWFTVSSGAAGQRLTPADASLISLDKNGNFVAEFPGHGVWLCTPSLLPANPWQQLLLNGQPTDAGWVGIDGNSNVLADFPGRGLWRYSTYPGWKLLTGSDPSKIALNENGDFVANFWNGIWRYEVNSNSWKQIMTFQVQTSQLAIDANDNVAAAIVGNGFWYYTDASGFNQRFSHDASWMGIDVLGDVIADFPGFGVRLYNGQTLITLNPADPSLIAID
jgi:hypothetical protein